MINASCNLEERWSPSGTAAAAARRRSEKPEAQYFEVGGRVLRPQVGVFDDVADHRSSRNAFLNLVAQVAVDSDCQCGKQTDDQLCEDLHRSGSTGYTRRNVCKGRHRNSGTK